MILGLKARQKSKKLSAVSCQLSAGSCPGLTPLIADSWVAAEALSSVDCSVDALLEGLMNEGGATAHAVGVCPTPSYQFCILARWALSIGGHLQRCPLTRGYSIRMFWLMQFGQPNPRR